MKLPPVTLINSMLHGKNETIPKIHQESSENFTENHFSWSFSKLVFLKFSDNPRLSLIILDFLNMFGELDKNFQRKICNEF